MLRQIEQRFGAVPAPIKTRLRAINSIERLAEMLTKLPLLDSPEDLVPRGRTRSKMAAS